MTRPIFLLLLGIFLVVVARLHAFSGVVLVAGAKAGLLDEETLSKGINDVLEVVPDLAIDVPQVNGQILVPAIKKVM